jgi:hypothetical protein
VLVAFGGLLRVVLAVIMGWCHEECIRFANIRATSLNRGAPLSYLWSMAYGARQIVVLVPMEDSRGFTALEKENVRFIEEQFSTVMNHP